MVEPAAVVGVRQPCIDAAADAMTGRCGGCSGVGGSSGGCASAAPMSRVLLPGKECAPEQHNRAAAGVARTLACAARSVVQLAKAPHRRRRWTECMQQGFAPPAALFGRILSVTSGRFVAHLEIGDRLRSGDVVLMHPPTRLAHSSMRPTFSGKVIWVTKSGVDEETSDGCNRVGRIRGT